MPFVLVFIFISHLIYWSILSLNRINLQRYSLYQDYYQAAIQERMADLWFEEEVGSLSQDLEAFIYDKVSDLYHKRKLEGFNHQFIEAPQFGWQLLEKEGDYERVYLFSQSLYLSESAFDMSESFQRLSVNGSLTPTNLPVSLEEEALNLSNIRNLQEELELVHNSLLDQGFRLSQQDEYRQLFPWNLNLDNPLLFHFNQGATLINLVNGHKTSESHISPRNFVRSQSLQFERVHFLLYWQSFIYEREVLN